jgi:hypothetical protein
MAFITKYTEISLFNFVGIGGEFDKPKDFLRKSVGKLLFEFSLVTKSFYCFLGAFAGFTSLVAIDVSVGV